MGIKYSIILPVRNGGEYFKDAVTSILNQSFTHFTLHILDNDSTDGTLEWIQSVNDKRITIYSSKEPLSIEQNWGRIKDIPKNEFMTMIGHDDILHVDYLATMDELIKKYPDATLYQTHFNYIDAKGDKIRDCKPMKKVETSADFLSSFLSNTIDVMGTGFMMRSKDYDKLGGIPLYPNLLFADFELWLRLTQLSYKATAEATCFSFRLHQSTTTNSSDIKFQQAFEQFISFLADFNKADINKVIQEKAAPFLLFYCKGLSHRLLRTPKSTREGLSVNKFINNCKGYATLLGVEKKFDPDSVWSLKFARLIDGSSIGRKLFIAFKRVYSKPILKGDL